MKIQLASGLFHYLPCINIIPVTGELRNEEVLNKGRLIIMIGFLSWTMLIFLF